MGGDPITSAIASAVVGKVVGSVTGGDRSARRAAQANERAASATAAAADQDMNRKNMKQPDVAGLMSSNTLAAKSGNLSTLLTGSQGIGNSQLPIARNTLLGQ